MMVSGMGELTLEDRLSDKFADTSIISAESAYLMVIHSLKL